MKTSEPARHPGFYEAFRFWLKLGFISFGGPAGQIAIMQTELVDRKKWISQDRFLHALNYCMLLPGPEAQQLCIYIGWLLHKTWGGIVAGSLFVIPSMFVLWGLSFVYAAYGHVAWIAAIFYGLKPAVTAIVASAVIRLGRRALKNWVMWAIAATAFAAIFFPPHLPFPLIICAAALLGAIGGNLWKDKFPAMGQHQPAGEDDVVLGDRHESPRHARPSLSRALKIIAFTGALWWTPIVLIGAWLGPGHTVFREGLFFSKAAVVTFGGAYAVLPYVAQQAVQKYAWLRPGQMMDGLGLAETTPGPLIMVLQFVGFMGGWNSPGGLPPLAAATLGAFITTWATFVPCFLWIFLGAPYIEQLRGSARLGSALSAVTAAVVGVILNLAVWFSIQVFFPKGNGVDLFAVIVCFAAFTALVKWNRGVVPVIAASALLGLAHSFLRHG